MSSANEFLFSSRFSFAGEVSGLVSAFAYGTVPTDFAISSMPPMTWSGPSSRGTLPLHSGMVAAAGISSVMLRAVPCRAVPADRGPAPPGLLPRGGELLLTPAPRGLVPCEWPWRVSCAQPAAAPSAVPGARQPNQRLPCRPGPARCIIEGTIIIYINKQSEARQLLCWPGERGCGHVSPAGINRSLCSGHNGSLCPRWSQGRALF